MPVAKPKLHDAELPPRRDAGQVAHAANPDRTLTLAEAAGMLGIPQTLLAHILDQDIVPHHTVGGHPRILLRDVLAYKKVKERRNKALDRIAAESQRLGLG